MPPELLDKINADPDAATRRQIVSKLCHSVVDGAPGPAPPPSSPVPSPNTGNPTIPSNQIVDHRTHGKRDCVSLRVDQRFAIGFALHFFSAHYGVDDKCALSFLFITALGFNLQVLMPQWGFDALFVVSQERMRFFKVSKENIDCGRAVLLFCLKLIFANIHELFRWSSPDGWLTSPCAPQDSIRASTGRGATPSTSPPATGRCAASGPSRCVAKAIPEV